MKEMVKKTDSTQIVLDDKELTLIIQRMIEDAIQKKYRKTYVMNAISQTWSNMIPKEKIKLLELTSDEQNFFEKVDMFFSEYGQAFVTRVNWFENGLRWQNRKEIEKNYEKHILDSLIMFAKSAFCTFCREDTITLANIKKYNMQLFGRKYVLPIDLYPIRCALDDLFVVDGKPFYVLKKDCKNIYSFSIERNENYQQFIKKYSYRRTELTQITMKLIWIISSYY